MTRFFLNFNKKPIIIRKKYSDMSHYFNEEISYTMGYINTHQLLKLAEPLKKNGYGKYLLNLFKDKG